MVTMSNIKTLIIGAMMVMMTACGNSEPVNRGYAGKFVGNALTKSERKSFAEAYVEIGTHKCSDFTEVAKEFTDHYVFAGQGLIWGYSFDNDGNKVSTKLIHYENWREDVLIRNPHEDIARRFAIHCGLKFSKWGV